MDGAVDRLREALVDDFPLVNTGWDWTEEGVPYFYVDNDPGDPGGVLSMTIEPCVDRWRALDVRAMDSPPVVQATTFMETVQQMIWRIQSIRRPAWRRRRE